MASDATEPTPQRQAELLKEKASKERDAPYADVKIRTSGEVLWIIDIEKWGNQNRINFTRANLSGIDLSEVNLSYAIFRGANLSGSSLYEANLSGADLAEANLNEAHLNGAILSGANLTLANLSDADLTGVKLSRTRFDEAVLSRADLTGADLSQARLDKAVLYQATLCKTNLSRAYLNGAILSGADLRQAMMDEATVLDKETELDFETKLGDIIWNGVSLTRVNWTKVPKLGDEAMMQETKGLGRRKHIDACRNAARAYKALAIVLRAQGLSTDASKYRLRGLRLERKAHCAEHKFKAFWVWVGSWVLDLVCGYGYRPLKSVLTYGATLLLFTGLYFVLTPGCHTTWWQAIEAFVESISAFHGRAVFPVQLQPYDWRAVVAAAESVIGLILEVIFVVAFTRRFLEE